jgi:hypothetical protein
MFKAGIVWLILLLSMTACVAPEDIILPSKYQRISQSDAYKSCVATATNRNFDETTKPDVIARNSLMACSNVKNTMLTAYPQRWRENYIQEVDAQLFQREVDWIVETRTKKNRFFR